MANETFTANQSTVLALDPDGDGVIDPGEAPSSKSGITGTLRWRAAPISIRT
jgi:hypothetical protein